MSFQGWHQWQREGGVSESENVRVVIILPDQLPLQSMGILPLTSVRAGSSPEGQGQIRRVRQSEKRLEVLQSISLWPT